MAHKIIKSNASLRRSARIAAATAEKATGLTATFMAKFAAVLATMAMAIPASWKKSGMVFMISPLKENGTFFEFPKQKAAKVITALYFWAKEYYGPIIKAAGKKMIPIQKIQSNGDALKVIELINDCTVEYLKKKKTRKMVQARAHMIKMEMKTALSPELAAAIVDGACAIKDESVSGLWHRTGNDIADVYGELNPLPFAKVVEKVNGGRLGEQFLDIGSGGGKLVCVAAAMGMRAIGVEMNQERHEAALDVKEQVEKMVAAFYTFRPQIELINGKIGEHYDLAKKSDFVLSNNLKFPTELNGAIEENILMELKEGSSVMSLLPYGKYGRRGKVSLRMKDDFAERADVEVCKLEAGSVSWNVTGVEFFLYKINGKNKTWIEKKEKEVSEKKETAKRKRKAAKEEREAKKSRAQVQPAEKSFDELLVEFQDALNAPLVENDVENMEVPSDQIEEPLPMNANEWNIVLMNNIDAMKIQQKRKNKIRANRHRELYRQRKLNGKNWNGRY